MAAERELLKPNFTPPPFSTWACRGSTASTCCRACATGGDHAGAGADRALRRAQRIQALDIGADDYVVKPVDLHELAARLRALVRRSQRPGAGPLSCNGVDLLPASREVWADGEAVKLSSREFSLLHVLMLRPGRVLTREQLENHPTAGARRSAATPIEVHVHHLRRKLGSHRIRTVRGVGYAFAASRQRRCEAGPRPGQLGHRLTAAS